MKTLYTMQEAADILGVSSRDVKDFAMFGRLGHTWIKVSNDSERRECYIPESDLYRFAYRYANRLPNCTLKFNRPKTIRIEMTLEVNDEYYDEGYQRIYNRARDMYERQRIDDLY